MFLAIVGLILLLAAVAAIVMFPRANKKYANAKEAKLKAAMDMAQEAEELYNRYNQWVAAPRDERSQIDPEGRFHNLGRYELEDKAKKLQKHAVDIAVENGKNTPSTPRVMAAFSLVAAMGMTLILLQCFYRQDIGEAKVQVSWSGQLVGQSTEPGFHFKAPWVSVRTFDVRNNLVSYVGQADQDGNLDNYAGNVTTGPQITFQDKEGVTGNLDLTLRYSIEPGSVLDMYSNFATQENFVNKVISEGVRAESRVAPSTKGTLEVYSNRAGLSADIRAGLEKRWAGLGVIIEDVAVQEIRYSADVQSRFDEAQAARIAIDKAEADQEAATVTARTKVIEAQGVADAAVVAAKGQSEANELLTKSLTEQVLQQRWIDALKEGTVYVVEPGTTPFVTVK